MTSLPAWLDANKKPGLSRALNAVAAVRLLPSEQPREAADVQQCLTGIHSKTGTLWTALAMCLAIIGAEAQFDVTNTHISISQCCPASAIAADHSAM
ncbi:MAG: hypothetical protein EOR60_03105 [Mesorhizobium sp.]|nr:MAG: hypothetical protein EOR60_03105 [Mesorhizobium sp.]